MQPNHNNKPSKLPPQDWATLELPDAWPDVLPWLRPAAWKLMLGKISGKTRARVVLPPGMPGSERIPRYVLQEFHNLPNGNYSKRICRGYSRGFDHAMLGSLHQGRGQLAAALAGCRRVLDLGCGSGRTMAVLRAAGIPEVIGLDPSPYQLQLAAAANPGAHLIQGVGEDIDLPDASVDGICVCFVFHEIPPTYLRRVLAEMARISQPGATLAVLEPSAVQWQASSSQMLRTHGLRGLYFRLLARRVFEPFVAAWHKQDFPALLREFGFELVEDSSGCPFRFVVARRSAALPPYTVDPTQQDA